MKNINKISCVILFIIILITCYFLYSFFKSGNNIDMPNYEKEYLKIKQRYIDSKSNNFFEELKKLYPTTQFDKDRSIDYGAHKITYGELSYEGLEDILIHFNYNFDTFIDIGSGRGKLCLYASGFNPINKSIGIELVKERHDDAISLKDKLKRFNNIQKVEFYNGDIFKMNMDSFIKPNSKAVIWISNLCFDEEFNEKLFDKLIKELPKGVIISCSKKPKEHNSLENIGEIDVKMSWSDKSPIYFLKTK